MSKEKIVIVGAGVGGLATAARLASRGYSVDVYEKLSECGGRAHVIEDRGFKFDTGPSFVLMPDFFKEVFSDCGEKIEDYLDLKILETSYKILYPDGDTLTVFKDATKTKAELERFEAGGALAYDKFIAEMEKVYTTVKPLLYKCFSTKDLLNPSYWDLILKLNPFATYWQIAKKYFKSEKICYAMTFEAMFIGVSPFKTPSFYSVITYADHVQKISHPMGGMYQIPKALERLAKKFGVQFHYNKEITKVEPEQDKIVLKTGGGEVAADKVVINADYAHAQSDLLGKKIPNYNYSCSVYLLFLGLKQKIPGAEHHALFFAKDLRRNLKDIFDENIVSEDPSFYIHVPTTTDASLAPEGKDILYLLIPVPNLKNKNIDFEQHEDMLRKVTFEKINKQFNINLEDLIEVEHKFYPKDFVGRYNIKFGATFGLAHTLMQSAFFRPVNVDRKHKNLYFVGASVQPGGGLPPVIASSRIVADLISEEKK